SGAGARFKQRRGGIGVAHAEVDEIQFRIVAARGPDTRAETLFDRRAVPGITARAAGTRNSVEPPALLSGGGIECHDEIATLAVEAQACPEDDQTTGDQRATAEHHAGIADAAGNST